MTVVAEAAALLAALDFAAPAFALWWWVLRKSGDDVTRSLVAAAGLSVFLIPTVVFILNRGIGYPLDVLGTTVAAVLVVLAAGTWRFVLRKPLAPVLLRLRGWLSFLGE